MVMLSVSKDCDQTRKVLGLDLSEPCQGRHAIIQADTGNHDGHQHAQGIDQQMALAPVDFLAAIIPALGTSHLGGLDRLAITAGGTRGGLAPCCHAVAFSQGLDQPGPGSSWMGYALTIYYIDFLAKQRFRIAS